jgi:hypothetical protein
MLQEIYDSGFSAEVGLHGEEVPQELFVLLPLSFEHGVRLQVFAEDEKAEHQVD